ncbi:MAG: SCO family protein [Candidatus Zixiibacteriota bacterium]
MTDKAKSPLLTWVVPIVALLAVIAAIVVNSAERSRSRIPELGDVPSFALTRSTGEKFIRTDLNGRLHVVNFMFTRCQGVCPVMSANIKKMYDLYRGLDKVHFLSITVDPDHDSLAVLQQYAREYGVNDGRWIFARGALVDVAALIEHGFMLDASELPANHPSRLILVDQEGQIRGYYSYNDEDDLEALRTAIRELARQM